MAAPFAAAWHVEREGEQAGALRIGHGATSGTFDDRRVVRLAGLSRVAGGADGWLSDSAVVFDFEANGGDGQRLSFSTRYSSALVLHERMVGTGSVALGSIEFPAKCRLSNMRDNVDNVLARGQDLAAYYTKLLAAAAAEPLAQTWVEEELLRRPGGHAGETPHQEATTGVLDGVVAFQCDDRAPLFLRCNKSAIVEVTASPSSTVATAQISATQQLWEQCFQKLLQPSPPRQLADAESLPVADLKPRCEITEARLRHGLLHTGLSVRVEYTATHCQLVKLRWFRRSPSETPRARRLGQSRQPNQLAAMTYISGAGNRAEYTLSPLDVGCTIGCECIGVGDLADTVGGIANETTPTLVEQARGSGKVGYAPTVLSLTSSCA
jgi:hypothetical protein